MGRSEYKENAGITLVEVLVGLAIVALLTRLAVPSYRFIINSSRISSEVSDLLTTLQFARSEAMRRGVSVSVCASTNASACSASSDWTSGWMAFEDTNSNGAADDNTPVMRSHAAITNGDKVQADNSTGSVRFNREGIAAGLAADPVTLTFTPPTNPGLQKRCLAIGVSGRMLVRQPAVGVC